MRTLRSPMVSYYVARRGGVVSPGRLVARATYPRARRRTASVDKTFYPYDADVANAAWGSLFDFFEKYL